MFIIMVVTSGTVIHHIMKEQFGVGCWDPTLMRW